MTGPVIAGVDGGPTSPDALALGRWFAETYGVPLIAAVVHPAPAALGSGRVDAEWVADRHRAAERVLDAARKELEGVREEVDYRLVGSSSAAHGLHDLAEQTGASMIVVGSGRAAPKDRLMAGSTAERLLAGSRCPIAVAPAGPLAAPGDRKRIGVAYVDTPDGRAALDIASDVARRTGDKLRLYTVVAEGDATLPFLIGDDVERAFLETARETYESSLNRAAGSIAGVEADWEVLAGNVVDELADLTDVDVLFCGSRGYGPARRVLLGGVSTKLVRRACRPLVVVPRSG
ncbi:universal stress protein [Actinoplanes bogorensis]|uniref:Universal stress protein n=1 Tax=Paractinoplanes bogorensis TaxID=1610840 RepID=A0ABS5Z0N0_9ACTN|nr:universal stress protein [Actinoplanes bogorensis]MBU2669249.1 universal stress protein [Actinoplanes bogorensis]